MNEMTERYGRTVLLSLAPNAELFEGCVALEVMAGSVNDFATARACVATLGFEVWIMHESRHGAVFIGLEGHTGEDSIRHALTGAGLSPAFLPPRAA